MASGERKHESTRHPNSPRQRQKIKDRVASAFSPEAPQSSMSTNNAGQPVTFADIATSYRVYILDDLLAEPQEVCYDWSRGLLYIAQRYLQGNNFAPIERSTTISVFDINAADVVGTIDLRPSSGPHGMKLDESCAHLSVHVAEGGLAWVSTDTRMVTWYTELPAAGSRRDGRRGGSAGGDDFIAEIDLRSGRMRRRVNVPPSEMPASELGGGRFVAFSSPAIRFAAQSSSSRLPVIDAYGDPIIAALRQKFDIRCIYVTSLNVILV